MKQYIPLLILFLVATISLPADAGTWSDGFESGNLDGYQYITQGGPSAYATENGELSMEVHTGYIDYFRVAGSKQWKDYTVTVKVKMLEEFGIGAGGGTLLRENWELSQAASEDRFYNFTIADRGEGFTFPGNPPEGHGAIALLYLSGEYKNVKAKVFPPELDHWYTLKAIAQGSKVEFYVDNYFVGSFDSPEMMSGGVGMHVGNAHVHFDDFVVTGPDIPYGGPGIWSTTIVPQRGKVTGGENIAILGKGFPPGVSVTIGGKPLDELNATDTLITGKTPPGIEGEQDILITSPDRDYSVFAGKFYYQLLSNVIITSMTPSNGKQTGGDIGIIAGSGFLAGATVTIGDTQATDVSITPTLITFRIPPGTAGAKDVVVTNPDGQKGILNKGYTYNPFIPPPKINNITPHKGSLTLSEQVFIYGSGFIRTPSVRIGGITLQKVAFVSSDILQVEIPMILNVGPQDIIVTNPDGQSSILTGELTIIAPPKIKSIEPTSGNLDGGTEITITGDSMVEVQGKTFPTNLKEIERVLIGEVECTEVTVRSDYIVTAITPPNTPGIKSITVIDSLDQDDTLDNAFTYNASPQIARVIPNNGRLSGGTKITIEGSGFIPGAEVVIIMEEGGNYSASSVQVMSPNIITAVSPQGKPGAKDVRVINGDGQEVRLPGGFTYNPIPTITKITPNYGSSSGGTKIAIEGTGFLQGVRVMVGDRSATAQLKDDMTIEAVTPSNRQGTWDVRVINPDTQEAVIPKGFVSVGELVYNFPNPFRASQGTTFRYVTNVSVQSITVRIFNIAGVPIDIVHEDNSKEVRWQNSDVHIGMYFYDMEVKLGSGEIKHFKRMLEVRK